MTTVSCVECNRQFVPDAALLAVLPWPETEGACSPMCNIFLHLTRPECREVAL